MKIRSLDIDLKLVFNEKGDFVRHFDSGKREDEQVFNFLNVSTPAKFSELKA